MIGQEGNEYLKSASDPLQVSTEVVEVVDAVSEIRDLQFQRTGDGEGKLTLDLSNPAVDVNVFSEGGDVNVQFIDTTIAPRLMRRFEV